MSSVYTQTPLSTPVTITAGDSVRLPFQLTWILPDGDRQSVDLNQYTLGALLLQPCGSQSLTVEIVDMESATILVDIPSSITSNLAAGSSCVFQLNLTDQYGNLRQIARGWITVMYGQVSSTSCF